MDHRVAAWPPAGFRLRHRTVFIVTLGFAAGAITRALTLWLAAHGWSRALTISFNIAGLFIAFGIALVPTALEAWERRAPSQDCASALFKVDVAGARLMVPVSPLFNIYSGDRSYTDAHYLWSNPHVRALCAQTANGTQAARATNVSLYIDGIRGSRAATCDTAPTALREGLCAALPEIRDGRMLESDFPLNARVFAPDEIETRYFGGATRSTYEEFALKSSQVVFLKTDATTPDGKPLTFACGEGSLGYVCHVAYPWVGGAYLSYGFHAPASAAIEKGLRVDAVMRRMFDAMRAER